MDELHLAQRIATIAIWVLPALFAITVHEVAYGWVARALGDPTAMMLGRLTVNPLKHIDPVGTVLLPGLLLYLGGFVFGWARPVPVTRENLRDPHRDMALVAVAGPGANLVMALFWTLVVRLGALTHEALPWLGVPLVYMGVNLHQPGPAPARPGADPAPRRWADPRRAPAPAVRGPVRTDGALRSRHPAGAAGPRCPWTGPVARTILRRHRPGVARRTSGRGHPAGPGGPGRAVSPGRAIHARRRVPSGLHPPDPPRSRRKRS